VNASDSLHVGREFGRYRVLSLLGRGGLASVWRAKDPLLGRDVALKILHESAALSPKGIRRFIHEAQSVSRLDHPGIVSVFDAGECDGLAYMALTLVEGDTVSDLASRRLMPVDDALRIAAAAGEALSHAHVRGVIHRDVTGRNIMVARDGRVFVVDFGLALVPELSRLTSTQTILGTMAYLAPEAIGGGGLDARADIYGLGVVLFEALTGTFPFVGDRHEVVAHEKFNGVARRVSELRPALPGAVDELVARAIARDPAARFESMDAMVEALNAVRQAPVANPARIPSPPPAPPRAAPSMAPDSRPTRPDPLYVAVLPFSCDSDDAEVRSLAGRLADTIAAALGNEAGIRFVPRAAEAEPVASAVDLRQIAERIGANVLVYGNVVHRETRVRVTLTAIDAPRGVQIGSNVIDGAPFQPFAIEDAVIAAVRQALGLSGTPAARASRPSDPAADDHLRMARRHMERFDRQPSLETAIRLLETLLAERPEDAELHALLGRAFLLMYDTTMERAWVPRAASAVERAVEREPGLPQAVLAGAELSTATGRAETACTELEQLLRRHPDFADAWLSLARAQHVMRDDSASERSCLHAAALKPSDWRPHHILGQIRFLSGDHAGAVEAWETVIRLTPDNARARRNLGSAYFHMDRCEEAVAALQRSLDEMPTPAAYTNYGTVLFYMGRREEAIWAFDQAVAHRPHVAWYWGNLGNACRLTHGFEFRTRPSLDRAIALMRDSLDRNPEDAEGLARLAGWYANLGENDAADHSIARALELAPTDVLVLNSAAHVALQLGRVDDALRLFREAVTRGTPLMLLERDPELESLRGTPEFQELLAEGRAMRRAAVATRGS
jgi:serine/threonine-protein kinase